MVREGVVSRARAALVADARSLAAQVARYRHRAWWKGVRAVLRRLPSKRERQAWRREDAKGET